MVNMGREEAKDTKLPLSSAALIHILELAIQICYKVSETKERAAGQQG